MYGCVVCAVLGCTKQAPANLPHYYLTTYGIVNNIMQRAIDDLACIETTLLSFRFSKPVTAYVTTTTELKRLLHEHVST